MILPCVYKNLPSTRDGQVPLPEKIFPCIMSTLAWGNIDMLEETLTGGGTSHRVNRVIVQPTVYAPQPQSQVLQPAFKK